MSTVGNDAFEKQQQIVEAAIRASVKRFIPYDFGIDTTLLEVQNYLLVVMKFVKFLESKEKEGLS